MLFFGLFVDDELEGYAHLYEYECVVVNAFAKLRVHVCFVCVCVHALETHLIVCGSLLMGMFVNSKEILLDLPLHLFCVMSLPAMWCSLSD